MPAGQALNPATLARMQIGYADLNTTVAVTAKRLGVAPATLWRTARQLGWEPRTVRRRAGRLAVAASADPPPDPAVLSTQLATLPRLTGDALAVLQGMLMGSEAVDPERTLRALATYVRVLASLQKLQAMSAEEPEPDDEPPPRTLSELRDELRNHLERIRRERHGQLSGETDPS